MGNLNFMRGGQKDYSNLLSMFRDIVAKVHFSTLLYAVQTVNREASCGTIYICITCNVKQQPTAVIDIVNDL